MGQEKTAGSLAEMFRVIALGVVREMPAADSTQNTILMNAQVFLGEGNPDWTNLTLRMTT